MFTLYAIAGAAITVIMLLINPWVLRLMQTPADCYGEALAYLNICMGGTLFIVGYNAVSAVLRGMGDSRHPLIFVGVAAVVNIVLDLVFVGVFHMGAAGAAWATIAAQALSLTLSIVFLRRRDFVFDFHPRSFKMDKALAGQLVKLGIPASLQGTLVSLSFMVLMTVANGVAGLTGSAALSIAGKVNSVAILPSLAMQASVSSMAGQNIGAGKPERARKTMFVAMGMSFVFSALMFAVVNLFPAGRIPAGHQLGLSHHQHPVLHQRPGHGRGADPVFPAQRLCQLPAGAHPRRRPVRPGAALRPKRRRPRGPLRLPGGPGRGRRLPVHRLLAPRPY